MSQPTSTSHPQIPVADRARPPEDVAAAEGAPEMPAVGDDNVVDAPPLDGDELLAAADTGAGPGPTAERDVEAALGDGDDIARGEVRPDADDEEYVGPEDQP